MKYSTKTFYNLCGILNILNTNFDFVPPIWYNIIITTRLSATFAHHTYLIYAIFIPNQTNSDWFVWMRIEVFLLYKTERNSSVCTVWWSSTSGNRSDIEVVTDIFFDQWSQYPCLLRNRQKWMFSLSSLPFSTVSSKFVLATAAAFRIKARSMSSYFAVRKVLNVWATVYIMEKSIKSRF